MFYEDLSIYTGLAVSLGVGLLVGIERGWNARKIKEGERTAGIRTFSLIGIVGGLTGLLSSSQGSYVFIVVFLSLSILIILGYFFTSHKKRQDKGMTTEIAALTVFLLSASASLGYSFVAVVGALLTVTLLGFKPTLHNWVASLKKEELLASLKLLLLSLVILPLLPNKDYGQWGSVNPFEIGWMVVLIAGISYFGYLGVNIAGTKKGLSITALFGGLASSTAVTFSFSRLAQKYSKLHNLLVSGIILASAIMFPRIAFEVAIVNPKLLLPLLPPLALMFLSSLLAAWWFWNNSNENKNPEGQPDLKNPFEIKSAFQFGLILLVVSYLTQGLKNSYGDQGVYILSFLSGIVDVDAITLSLSKMSNSQLAGKTAIYGIIIAAMTNTVFKFSFFIYKVRSSRISWRLILVALGILLGGFIGVFLSITFKL